MELNAGQEAALKRFKRWWAHKNHRQVFELSGGPGTGKTFLVRKMIESINLDMENVLFCAYTGKAAIALRKNGLNGRTIHSTLYDNKVEPKMDKNGEPMYDDDDKLILTVKFVRKKKLDPWVKLIVVDEASMVPVEFGEEIKRFKIPILAVGDLHQLGPIFGSPYFLNHPDAILTEIMRQEKDSPIISIAQDILKGKFLRYGEYDSSGIVTIMPLDEVPTTVDFKSMDAILCGMNKTRVFYNKYIRKYVYGIDESRPVVGDKMICRKNNWTIEANDIPLVNGLTGVISDVDESSHRKNSMIIDFQADDITASFDRIRIDLRMLNKLKIDNGLDSRSPYDVFDYGYAITGHLAQGSQYNNVLVINDINRFSDSQRWVYTSVTRAIDKLILAF